MGFLGMCHGIGYGFRGSRSFNRVSFLTLVTVFLMWSFYRVGKVHVNKMICNRSLIALNRVSFFGSGP